MKTQLKKTRTNQSEKESQNKHHKITTQLKEERNNYTQKERNNEITKDQAKYIPHEIQKETKN